MHTKQKKQFKIQKVNRLQPSSSWDGTVPILEVINANFSRHEIKCLRIFRRKFPDLKTRERKGREELLSLLRFSHTQVKFRSFPSIFL